MFPPLSIDKHNGQGNFSEWCGALHEGDFRSMLLVYL